MKYSASSLSFPQGGLNNLKKLDRKIGIEIFYEFASEDMWRYVLGAAMEGREGEFSIHSPMYCADICETPEEELYRILRAPFGLYHRFHGSFYVLHSQGESPLPEGETERAKLREKVTKRIRCFSEICEAEGVTLAVENLFRGVPGPLFDEEQYLALFAEAPKAKALIDVGHAVLGRYDIWKIQEALGERLIGYHIHDNDGVHDCHWRMGAEHGVVDWERFCRGVGKFTPEAALVMEYGRANVGDYSEDRARLEELEGRLRDELLEGK